jgi:hypothetical protein
LSGNELLTATYDLGQPREDTRVAIISAALNTMLGGATIASLIVESEEPPTRLRDRRELAAPDTRE